MPWYSDSYLLDQVNRFQNLVCKDGCQLEVYEKQLQSQWRPIQPSKMQEDVLAVYFKSIDFIDCPESKFTIHKIVEGSLFNYEPKVYLK